MNGFTVPHKNGVLASWPMPVHPWNPDIPAEWTTAYNLFYIDEEGAQELSVSTKRCVYCREKCTAYYSELDGGLNKFTGQAQFLLERCDDFTMSPDGRTVLFVLGNKLCTMAPNGCGEVVEVYNEKKAIPLLVSNDRKLIMWAVRVAYGYRLSLCDNHGQSPKLFEKDLRLMPLLVTNRTGTEVMVFGGEAELEWNGKPSLSDKSDIYVYVPGEGLVWKEDYYELLSVTGYDTLQVGGTFVAFNANTLAGVLVMHNKTYEATYEYELNSVSLYTKEDEFIYIEDFSSRPIHFYNRSKKYMVGAVGEYGGGLSYCAVLKNNLPAAAWSITSLEEIQNIRIVCPDDPKVVMLGNHIRSITDLIAVWPVSILAEVFRDNHIDSGWWEKKDWPEWLASHEPPTIIDLDYSISKLVRYEKNRYIAYITDEKEEALIFHSLEGKDTMRFDLLWGFPTSNESCSKDCFVFDILLRPLSEQVGAVESQEWFFDAGKWVGTKTEDGIKPQDKSMDHLLACTHDWRLPESVGRSVDLPHICSINKRIVE